VLLPTIGNSSVERCPAVDAAAPLSGT